MKKRVSILAFMLQVICLAHAEILFQENFEDTNFASRGWYDALRGEITTEHHVEGSTAAFQCKYSQGGTSCAAGAPGRRLFEASDTVYLSFWAKYSDNFIGSAQSYHPHEFHFLTNKDNQYVGPARSRLSTYTEQVGGKPMMAIQDSLNVNTGCILRNSDPITKCDSYAYGESRSVASCNGIVGDLDLRDCFNTGSYWYSARAWFANDTYFRSEPGPYYKGDWHFIEAMFQMNSIVNGVGIPDGKIRYWYDGELLISLDRILLRTGANSDMRFNQFFTGFYIGDGSPITQYMWVDNLTVSSHRIGYSGAQCTPQWICTEWGSCLAGQQNRTCTDANSCSAQRTESQSCQSAGCGNMPSSWMHCDDFENDHDLTRYDDRSLNNLAVSDADSHGGSFSLRQHYDQGQVNAGWLSYFYCDALGQSRGSCEDDIYMRWYHKFEEGFEGVPPKMARITNLDSGWNKRFGVHYWVDENKQVVADIHAPYSTQANSAGWLPVTGSGFYYTGENIGRWVCHEMQVKKNTPGQKDGIVRFWIDGDLVVDKTGVDLVGSTSYNFNHAMIDTYWNSGSPKSQNLYYDDWVIARERIGCGAHARCTEADTDSDGSISSQELASFTSRWRLGDVSIASLMQAITGWKGGCNT